jgi:hypothetical protein
MRVKELIHTNTMGISVDEDDFVKTLQSEGVGTRLLCVLEVASDTWI